MYICVRVYILYMCVYVYIYTTPISLPSLTHTPQPHHKPNTKPITGGDRPPLGGEGDGAAGREGEGPAVGHSGRGRAEAQGGPSGGQERHGCVWGCGCGLGVYMCMCGYIEHHTIPRLTIPMYLSIPTHAAAAEAAVEAANAAKVEASTARRALEKAKVGGVLCGE